MFYPGYSIYNLPGAEERRAPTAASVLNVDSAKLPEGFPMHIWTAQAQRYLEYWRWFNGDILAERRAKTKDGKDVLKYPLGINPVRNFARKHAAILLGEEAFDTPAPLVKMQVKPKNPLNGQEISDDDKKNAIICQNAVNEVWTSSNGRALQMENATLAQFLGGCVFQLTWQHKRKDLLIPVVIKNIIPDFFLPVWKADDFYDLLEAYVVYKIPTTVAKQSYPLTELPNSSAGGQGYVMYVEHWTRDYYTITLDRTPILSDDSGTKILYEQVDNPFSFVPFVYIPHIREGGFWGNSMVPDIQGLARELNARAADVGDSIRETVHRKRYVHDLNGDVKPKQLDNGVWAINLGQTNPATKATPDVFTEDPPALPESATNFTSDLWGQLLREGHIGDIAFGEDEGSQRSALTLAFRMWPSTAHARMERAFWNEGLNTIAKMILRMCVAKAKEIPNVKIPDDFERKFSFFPDWLPMIPRDREQQVNEVILRFQAGLISPQRALEMLGDVRDIEEEIELIRQWQMFQASLQVATSAGGKSDAEGNVAGAGAATQLAEPIASSGLGAND